MTPMKKGTIGQIEGGWEPKQPFDKHVAESKWQYCMCKTCQERRHLIEMAPGVGKVDFDKLRHKDEPY